MILGYALQIRPAYTSSGRITHHSEIGLDSDAARDRSRDTAFGETGRGTLSSGTKRTTSGLRRSMEERHLLSE